jgi:tetratricopeptide (TPR) repeat protein
MNTIIKSILLTLVVLLPTSCSDSFVEVKPNDQNSEDYFNTAEEFDLAVVSAYDLLQSTYINVMLGEIASDNTLAGGESSNDAPGIQEIDDMRHTPLNAQLRDIWGWMFAGVNRANYVMEFQNKIDFTGKNVLLAEARFLRAYYYFELVKFFGDVPLTVDKRFLFGDQFTVGRTPKAEVYAQIEQDLIYASANLPAVGKQTGRATKGAAQALLGKAYLFQNKYAEAAEVLEQLITSGPYRLVTDYDNMFESVGENNAESVFEVQYSDKEGAGFGCLQCSEGNVAVGFNGIRNYNGPKYDSGFSFNVPTSGLANAFEPGDIRKRVAILDIEAWAASTGATFVKGYEHTGYYNNKYIARQGDLNTGDANLTNPNNYRAIRFADVLLMAAEANNKKSSADAIKSQAYLNRVRNRAGLSNTTLTGDALTNAIYRERRVELAGEGHRFFDLVRTSKAQESIPNFTVGKHEVFPIPAIEIQLAGNRWTQNPNY